MATYDAHTALLVVDVQNDFVDPSGSLYVAGGEQIVPEERRGRTRPSGGAPVVYTAGLAPRAHAALPTRRRDLAGALRAGTRGAAFHPDLLVADHEVVRKGHDGRDGYSGFSVRDPLSGERGDTLLHEMLVANGIERLVICGLPTDYCVVETVLDARMLGYPVEVLTDAAPAELKPGDGATALARMTRVGRRAA